MNIFNKYRSELWLFSLLIIISFCILGFDLQYFELSSNDGSSYLCSLFSYELLHPGLNRIMGCTYDHQPLYFFYLKSVRYIFSNNLNAIRYTHLLIWIFTCLCFYRICLNLKITKINSFLSAIWIFSLPFTVWINLQLRMYGLYYLSFFLLWKEYINERGDSKKSRIYLLLGYFNFFFIIIPFFGLQLFERVSSETFKLARKFKLYWWLLILISIKSYSIWIHRFVNRGSGGWYSNYSFRGHFEKMFLAIAGLPGQKVWLPFEILSVAFILILIAGLFFGFKKNVKWIKQSAFLIIFSFLIFGFLRLVVRIDEVEYRYFFYITPVLVAAGVFGLENKNKKFSYAVSLFLIVLIGFNLAWGKKNIVLEEQNFKRFVLFDSYLKSKKPRYLFSFDKMRDEGYIMAYQYLLYGSEVPIKQIYQGFIKSYVQVPIKVIVMVKEELPNTYNENHLFKKMISDTGANYSEEFCDFKAFPRYCIYNVWLNKSEMDRFSISELDQLINL